MRRILIGALCLCFPLHAEKVVQCIANFAVDEAYYSRVLQERGYSGKVVCTDIETYDTQLLKKKGGGWWQKIQSLFSSPIALEENVDKIVFFNLSPKTLKRYAIDRLPKEKVVLFLWEPKTVLPGMYAPAVLEHFSKIYTWDDGLVDGKRFFKFNYPVLSGMIEDFPAFSEKKFCTLMASHLKSSYPCELYSEREKIIDFFEQKGAGDFEFWGRGWDKERHPSYCGPAADKISIIKNYRFQICYENTSDAPGYITEKIFECFQAGTVPVYWGAPNVTDYIPKGCFIDRRAFATLEELYQFLKGMPEECYEQYLTQIRQFLRSDAAQRFSSRQLDEAFYRAVSG